MRARLTVVFLLVASAAMLCVPLYAHHAISSVYDMNRTVTLKGVVTNLEWTNPHSILGVAVKNESGGVEQWYAEILPPTGMTRAGWTKDILKPGDEVTVTGRPGKNAQKIIWLEYLVTADGRKLSRQP
jgi:DNA/RNA endonuclease YhcR with UshA esterase domain